MPDPNIKTDPIARPAPAASLAAITISRKMTETPEHCPGEPNTRAQDAAPVALVPTNDDSPVSVRHHPQPPQAFRAPRHVANFRNPQQDLPAYAATPSTSGHDIAPAAIIDLWEHLAGEHLRPKLQELDSLTIARQWPNSLLLRVTEHGRRPALEVAHMFVPTSGGPTVPIPIDAMTVDWIVALGREVVVTESPVHETDAVPTGNGPINCGVIALPFGPRSSVDHVLCHLYRVDETVLEGDAVLELRMPPRDRKGIKRLFGY
ncbi:MAG: hypothetical protein HOJ90_12170 [Alphaproteobacteria bacterium]|nr:hypothetical protein [Alphaproteobacteria bacterium]